jgi:hypothetical protein
LRKGLFRVAGEAQLKLGDRPLYIVPVGIDFDDYELPYSNLVVNIGQPIAVQPFMATYRENEPLALNRMRDALAAALDRGDSAAVLSAMTALRETADALESLVDDDRWPLPKYREMLFVY